MKDETLRLECANQITPKILEADETITFLAGRKQHAMEAHVVAWLHHSQQFINQIAEVLEELFIAAAVSHVPRAVAVCVEAGKRRREDRVTNRVIGDTLQNLHTIAVVQGIVFANDLFNAVHAASFARKAGTTICRAG